MAPDAPGNQMRRATRSNDSNSRNCMLYLDWLGLASLFFLFGALLEVLDLVLNDATFNLVAQLCWLTTAVLYLLDGWVILTQVFPLSKCPIKRAVAGGATGVMSVEWVPTATAYVGL